MEQLEIILMVQSSENQLFAKTSQEQFQHGHNQLLLVDTPLEINTEPLILLSQKLVNILLLSLQKMELLHNLGKFLISQKMVDVD